MLREKTVDFQKMVSGFALGQLLVFERWFPGWFPEVTAPSEVISEGVSRKGAGTTMLRAGPALGH